MKELAEDPILITNKSFSVGLVTRSQLYDLRAMPSDQDKAANLLVHIESSLHKEPRAFELFVGSLRSISTHVTLADAMSRVYRLHLVRRRMEKFSETDLNFTLMCNRLNDQRLISDSTKEQAFKLEDPLAFCRFLFKEMDSMGIGEVFLDLLDAFENTKSLRAILRDHKMDGVVVGPQRNEGGRSDATDFVSLDHSTHRSPHTSGEKDTVPLAFGGSKKRILPPEHVSTERSSDDYQEHLDCNFPPAKNFIATNSQRRWHESHVTPAHAAAGEVVPDGLTAKSVALEGRAASSSVGGRASSGVSSSDSVSGCVLWHRVLILVLFGCEFW